MKRFVLMIQFFTRIPIPVELQVNRDDFAKGAKWLPLVGLIIGSILAGVDMLLTPVFHGITASFLIVFLEILLSGGLHLDGLADSFDGLYSNRERSRILEIMKDSRIGSNGALAMIGLILLKGLLLSELSPGMGRAAILLCMPMYGRWAIVLASRFAKYAREKGMGNLFIGKVDTTSLFIALAVLLATLFLDIWLAVPIAIATVFTVIFMGHTRRIIGGMTGDTLGALLELTELLCLLGWVALVNTVG